MAEPATKSHWLDVIRAFTAGNDEFCISAFHQIRIVMDMLEQKLWLQAECRRPPGGQCDRRPRRQARGWFVWYS